MHPCFLRCTDSDRPQLAPNSPGYLLAVNFWELFSKMILMQDCKSKTFQNKVSNLWHITCTVINDATR